MPRKARVLVPNYPHHIVQRGHNQRGVFLVDEDYRFYLHNLDDWVRDMDIKLYAWCLMTNHIHLAVGLVIIQEIKWSELLKINTNEHDRQA